MNPQDIVSKMMEKDALSQWLGIEFDIIKEGYCKVKMTIRDEMVNGFEIAHGGISYSLADSALAFAANSYGQHAVSIGTSIKHLAPCTSGMVIYAETELVKKTRKLMHFMVHISSELNEKIALFEGTCYVKSTSWETSVN